MQKYEIMAIVKNSLDEITAKKVCQTQILDKIKKLGGNISFEDFWGERGFAYKINKQTWGYYFLAQFELDGANLSEMKQELNLEKELVRFLISKVEKNAATPRKYSEIKAEYEAQEKKKQVENTPKEEKKSTRREKLTTIKEKESSPSPKKDDVDKKLDDIISQSSEGI
ncbi:30S ribosomal protein S6 [Candidatus Gracilibacteria bacterium]|nr:30S ribosomal protein S6 [Candidatus Gracilibacteria bacterium]